MNKQITLFISMSIVLVNATASLHAQNRPITKKPVIPKTTSANGYSRSQSTPITPAAVVAQPVSARPTQVVRTQPMTTSRPAAPAAMNASRLRLGLRLGVNSSLISGLDFSAVPRNLQPARVTGFHAGAVLNIGGPNFFIQPELLFSQYGIRMTSGADYVQLKYNLLELPILLKASFGQPNLRVFINAGPVVTYTMGGTVSLLDAGQSDSQAIDLTGTGRLSYGASGGSGVSLKAGPGAVQLEARYTYLFSSNENNAKVNPQNFMVSVGYLFPL